MDSSSTSNKELFICFASRLSSSSMKISSNKSILSPGRVRDPPNTLPTSLSRRLRSNGSMKGGQASPMFPTGNKKRGSNFENPEPSSPKVTCIGQVRVKTKNKGRKLRTLSRKGSAGMSFRKIEQQNSGECFKEEKNQRWVNLPVTICDAFSCLFPCKSSCFSEREEKVVVVKSEGFERQSSCPEVFARWLVAVQDGECGGDERNDNGEIRNSRRHVFDELEISDEICEWKNVEQGRISVSVPPKNALLLMRCRSDPNKMAALANRFWESPVVEDEDLVEEEEKEKEENDLIDPEQFVPIDADEEQQQSPEQNDYEQFVSIDADEEEQHSPEQESVLYVEIENNNEERTEEQEEDLDLSEELLLLFQETDLHQRLDLEWENPCEDHQTAEKGEFEAIAYIQEYKKSSYCSSCSSSSITSDEESQETEESELGSEAESATEEVIEQLKTSNKRSDEEEEFELGSETESAIEEVIEQEKTSNKRSDGGIEYLPECLLMMMCEPKLSMEVSKETWVCSTDFIRQRPKKQVKQVEECDSEPIKIPALVQPQPRRLSCSLPVSNIAQGVSMAAMIEQKLVNGVGMEPFVLTRCKSAPLRRSDTCFWKSRNLDPHRHSNFAIGAAGIGV